MARTGCAFAAVTCLCGPARTHRDRQVLPAYGLQDLPIKIQNPSRGSKPNTMWLPITLGESLGRGHFYLAETRTFLLCVDIPSYANVRCHPNLLLRCLTPESVTRKGGHGGATECSGNGASSLCCGWRGSGELGPVGRRPGLDAMDLACARRCGPCTRNHRLLSVARIVWDE